MTGWSEPFPDLDSPSTLILAFGDRSVGDDPTPIDQLLEKYPLSCVLGCSTSGHINGTTIEDDGLVALITRLERGTLRWATAPVPDAASSERAGRALAAELDGADLRGVFVLSDGTSVNGSALTRGLRGRIPAQVSVSGGIAGDGTRFERTWVCCNDRPAPGRVVAVGFYGQGLSIWYGCRGGWEAFGPIRHVTRSRDNVLYELDGRPALDIYEEYLGDRANELPAASLLFPLALLQKGDEQHLVRTVLGIDAAERSMRFAGDVPEGAVVQFMQASFDKIIGGAADAASSLRAHRLDGKDSVCIPISCVGRRLMLQHRAEDELEEVNAILSSCRHHVGFYSYGEISPIVGSTCELHNQTMTLTVIAEESRAAA